MNTKLITTILILLTVGLTTADTDMSIYDRNSDGMLDADERMILDIDIEQARLTPAEILVIDTYTIDGTLLLNEEFRAVFLNPEAPIRKTVTAVTIVEDLAPVVEDVTVPTPTAEPVIVAAPVDEDVGGNLTLLMIVIVMAGGLIIYLYLNNIYAKQNKKE